ncbi:MAG: hypothetical protein GFH27_549289n272 [Chloroflexi bacterium AL-W]|nr:hypothetical protein [Chloroflexi bacterium AL-N1]NOK67004.1 hypothetical protein [Chloroflexi bacterium AL-N10]NOK74704.1 hypothetical protein [Chloroflexi bacterium AL-N5]NOK81606.1 hypothetical protein [Chloroflexi bacterium AL-W]NOK89076.1 hypothetical protein [Chloroflexi bacterium AL-N15]
MASQSRAQRRRHSARQQQRSGQGKSQSTQPVQQPTTVVEEDSDVDGVIQTAASVPVAPSIETPMEHLASEAKQEEPVRSSRRRRSRHIPEPIDYSKDYAAIRRDLRWIVLWSSLMLVLMVGLRFSGLL